MEQLIYLSLELLPTTSSHGTAVLPELKVVATFGKQWLS